MISAYNELGTAIAQKRVNKFTWNGYTSNGLQTLSAVVNGALRSVFPQFPCEGSFTIRPENGTYIVMTLVAKDMPKEFYIHDNNEALMRSNIPATDMINLRGLISNSANNVVTSPSISSFGAPRNLQGENSADFTKYTPQLTLDSVKALSKFLDYIMPDTRLHAVKQYFIVFAEAQTKKDYAMIGVSQMCLPYVKFPTAKQFTDLGYTEQNIFAILEGIVTSCSYVFFRSQVIHPDLEAAVNALKNPQYGVPMVASCETTKRFAGHSLRNTALLYALGSLNYNIRSAIRRLISSSKVSVPNLVLLKQWLQALVYNPSRPIPVAPALSPSEKAARSANAAMKKQQMKANKASQQYYSSGYNQFSK